MENLKTQIQGHDTFVREILTISGCPGLSVGILHQGEVIHTAHYGTREVGKELPPNDETLYRVASLTKALTASAVAMLMDDGLLEWDTPVREYLPEFRQRQDEIGMKATLRDLLSNRTGLAGGDYYWGQQSGDFLLPHNELVRMAAFTPAAKPFRKSFVYASWNYGLVTEIIEAAAGMTLGRYIDRHFSKPLGMDRTTLGKTTAYDNIASGYGLDVDGTLHKLGFPQMDDGIGLAGAYGGKSCIKDVLIMYRELLRSKYDQSQTNLHYTSGSPFRHTKDIFQPQIGVFGPTSYCMGLYKTVLPAKLGIASLNTVAWLGLKNSPTMGHSLKGLEVWHHTGNMPVTFSSAFLVPNSQTAVVVFTNGFGFMDPTDFVAQHLLAITLGEKPNEKYTNLAHTARTTNINLYPRLLAQMIRGYTGHTNRVSEDYEGYYWNEANNLCLTVTKQADGNLLMRVQDVPATSYNLEPYNGNTWWWPPNRKFEMCERGMWGFNFVKQHYISFDSSTGGQIDRLWWHHDTTMPRAEAFFRSEKKPTWKGYPLTKAVL